MVACGSFFAAFVFGVVSRPVPPLVICLGSLSWTDHLVIWTAHSIEGDKWGHPPSKKNKASLWGQVHCKVGS